VTPTGAQREWAVAVAGIALAAAAFFSRGGPASPGASVPFVVTVVPGDAHDLECAAAAPLGGERCRLDDQDHPTGAEQPLRPFVTTGGELILLARLFEEPHVAAWLREALAAGSTARVTLDCRGQYLGTSGPVRVRFGATARWDHQREVTAGRIEECTVVPR